MCYISHNIPFYGIFMRFNEILKGDLEDERRLQVNLKATNQLLKLLIEIYDQKNLALKFQELGKPYSEISREKLNHWKLNPDAHPICFHEKAIEDLKAHLLPTKPSHWDNPDFTFIDLFAGIGGIRKGFEEVGGRCVFTSEWEQKARRTYLANHYVSSEELSYFLDSEIENAEKNTCYMDITQITKSGDSQASDDERYNSIIKHIPQHDVLLAGFPCQPFSLAGVSKKNSLGRSHGFECDTQGTLFFDVEQILKVRQPKYCVLENVKNLKSHDKGNTFATIIRSLDQAGYWIADISNQHDDIEEAIKIVRKRKPEPTIIDGAHFTPQHRERIVLLGIRKDLISENTKLKEISLSQIPLPNERYAVADILCELSEEEQAKYTLTPNLWNYLYHYALKHQAKGNGFGFGLVDPKKKESITRTLSARYYKDGSEILINQSGLEKDYLEDNKVNAINKNLERSEFAQAFVESELSKLADVSEKQTKELLKLGEKKYDELYGRYASEFDPLYKTPRRLTPKECARLMGFEKPDKYRTEADADFKIVCPDTSAYKQFGNSVVVPVFRAVAELLKKNM